MISGRLTRPAAHTLAALLDQAGDSRTVMRQLVNAVATARGLTPPWDVPPATGLEPLGNPAGWGVVELGEMRAALLPARQRDAHGVIYTPPEVVGFQVRASLAGLDRLAGRPRPLEHILIHDPFCGPGIFLIHAARHITAWCIAQADPPADVPAHLTRAVTAQVMAETVYGTDLDETAVDIAKSMCWLEIDGIRPVTFMDDNVIVGDTFAGDLPPKLAQRWPLDAPGEAA